MSVSTSQPSSRSGYSGHGFPPAPKSVRLWPVVGPSREHDKLVPPDPKAQQAPRREHVPAWLVNIAIAIALALGILALLAAIRLFPLVQGYLGK
jgi:hypothetical protein